MNKYKIQAVIRNRENENDVDVVHITIEGGDSQQAIENFLTFIMYPEYVEKEEIVIKEVAVKE